VTAAKAESWFKAIDDGRRAIAGQELLIRQKRETKDAALVALKTRLRGLMDELKQLIGRQDPRWRDFGFNVPAEPATPAAPQRVTAQALPPGQLLVTCDPVPFADHYRVWTQGADSQLPPALASSSQEPMFLLKDLPAGEQLKLFVSAVNSAGTEGPMSEGVSAQAPASVAAA
jgi:hypothetical protein